MKGASRSFSTAFTDKTAVEGAIPNWEFVQLLSDPPTHSRLVYVVLDLWDASCDVPFLLDIFFVQRSGPLRIHLQVREEAEVGGPRYGEHLENDHTILGEAQDATLGCPV
jgi:hypothetical protein